MHPQQLLQFSLRLGPRRIRGTWISGALKESFWDRENSPDLFGVLTPFKEDIYIVYIYTLYIMFVHVETCAACELEATWPTESGRICQQAGWATANIPRIKPQWCLKSPFGVRRRAIINQWIFCTGVGHGKFESLANHQRAPWVGCETSPTRFVNRPLEYFPHPSLVVS